MQFKEYFERLSFQVEEKQQSVQTGKEFPWSKQFAKPPYTLSYKKCQPLKSPHFHENLSNADTSIPLNPLDRLNQYTRTTNNTISNDTLYLEQSESELPLHYIDPRLFYHRNNLTLVINNWLIVALGNTIYIHELVSTPATTRSQLPLVSEVSIITESPSSHALAEAIMPFAPNTINYITYHETENVILLADDFSRIVVIDVDKLTAAHNGTVYPPALENDVRVDILTHEKQFIVSVGYFINTNSSPWGLKLFKHVLYASDNSHRVTSFAFTKQSARQLNSSPDLLDNIPSIDVTTINQSVTIACTTIEGFVYLLDADLAIVDCMQIADTLGWLCKFIPQNIFLPVHTPQELTGDNNFPKHLLNDVIAQSISLEQGKSFKELGIAANLQHLNVPNISGDVCADCKPLALNPTTQLNRRLQFVLNKHQKMQSYLFLATRVKTGLFDLMLNNLASTSTIFSQNDDSNNNKINLCCELTKLHAIAIADPAGFVALIRFTEYHGIKAYRVENVLLDTKLHYLQRIIGLSSVLRGYDLDGNPEYNVIVTYTHMKVSIFHIRKSIRNNLDIYTVI